MHTYTLHISGVLEKAEQWIIHILISSDRISSSEKNDTKIIETGLVLLILWSSFELHVTENFSKKEWHMRFKR